MLEFSSTEIFLIILLSIAVIYIIRLSSRISSYQAIYKYDDKYLAEAISKSLDSQRYSVKGIIGEKLAPHMKEFLSKYEPADALFMGGNPIDYIVFNGYSRVKDTENPIDDIVFLEVKTSKKKKLSPSKNEAKIRDAINDEPPRVKYDLITIHTDA